MSWFVPVWCSQFWIPFCPHSSGSQRNDTKKQKGTLKRVACVGFFTNTSECKHLWAVTNSYYFVCSNPMVACLWCCYPGLTWPTASSKHIINVCSWWAQSTMVTCSISGAAKPSPISSDSLEHLLSIFILSSSFHSVTLCCLEAQNSHFMGFSIWSTCLPSSPLILSQVWTRLLCGQTQLRYLPCHYWHG